MSLAFEAYMFLAISTIFIKTMALDKPKDMTDEMYCLGCQVTIKELDFMLSKKPTRGMGETVTRALQRVCNAHNFNKYEMDSKKALEVCNHIIGQHDEGMEAVLITEYGRKHATGKHTSYLDITQMICGTVLKACYAPSTMGNSVKDDEGGITYDEESQEFQVKQGKKVRTPKPVPESGPNYTAATGSKPVTTEGSAEAQTSEKVKDTMEVPESMHTVQASVVNEAFDERVETMVYDSVVKSEEAEPRDEL